MTQVIDWKKKVAEYAKSQGYIVYNNKVEYNPDIADVDWSDELAEYLESMNES